ncbi:oligomeric Golgi complex subunit 6 [Chytriomyces sp. MP71]|nr:oligomeric Golgi complex subunit 6 [Chytriomyces sp. MP71]
MSASAIAPPKLPRSHPLSQKLHKILGHSLDSASTQRALEALDVFTANAGDIGDAPTPLAANLGVRLDARAMTGYRNVLTAFGSVVDAINAIEADLQSVNATYADMVDTLSQAKADSAALLAQTRELKGLRQKAIAKKEITNAFLERFTPSDEDVAILTSSSDISPDFFVAFAKLGRISDECNAVLMNEHQKAGNEIIESIAITQENAFNKLVSWIQIHQLPSNLKRETPELSPVLRKAMAALRTRPTLFQNCIDDISQIRQETIVQAFMDALTRGGPNGVPRPIELHAHDPVRYIGDMLAWLHQACVGERELVEGLLLGDVTMTSSLSNDDIFSTLNLGLQPHQHPDSIHALLNKSTERTIRPLKARIDEVLASHPGATIAYKIATTIQFYAHTIRRVIGPDATLCTSLSDSHAKAFKVFLDALESQGMRMGAFVQKPARDLAPPPAVKEAVQQLRELMASYESSVMVLPESGGVPDAGAGGDFEKILAASLDPLLDMCRKGAATLAPFENAIYVCNCLVYIQSAISLYEFTSARCEAIQSQIETQLGVLIGEQYTTVLKQSGLGLLIEAMDENVGKMPLAFVPLLDPRAISSTMSNLDVYLCTAGFDAQTRLSLLLSSQHREQALGGGFAAFMAAYARFHDAVMDPANKFEFPASILRPVDEIRTLLVV